MLCVSISLVIKERGKHSVSLCVCGYVRDLSHDQSNVRKHFSWWIWMFHKFPTNFYHKTRGTWTNPDTRSKIHSWLDQVWGFFNSSIDRILNFVFQDSKDLGAGLKVLIFFDADWQNRESTYSNRCSVIHQLSMMSWFVIFCIRKKEREFSGSQTPEEDGNGSDGNNSLVYAFNFQEWMYFVKKLGAMLESGVLTLLFF